MEARREGTAVTKKVLMVASTFPHIIHFHLPYLDALRQRGALVHVACGGEPAPIHGADQVTALPFKKKMWAPENFRAAGMLRRMIRREGYDLIVVHTSLAAFFTRLAVMGMKGRPRLINMVHGYLFDEDTPALKRAVLLAAEKLTAGVTDLVLVMNRWDLALAQRRRLGKRVAYVPGIGVEPSRFQSPEDEEQGERLRRQWGVGPEGFVLLYGAEFSKRKSQSVLISAMTRLPERVTLVLSGGGALLDQCRAQAQALGLAGRVIFPGYVERMEPLYAAADAAVSASRSEGLPLNIMEAMCCGKPVVASDVKGNADLVGPDETGFLYPYGDEGAFAAAVERLLQDGQLCRRMGSAARQAVEPYCLERVLPQVMEQYESLL